jgi:hypothetical protein
MSPKPKAVAVEAPIKSKFTDGIERAIKAGVPIVEVATPDPSSSMNIFMRTAPPMYEKFGDPAPQFIQWDTVRGMRGIGKPGAESVSAAIANAKKAGHEYELADTVNIVAACELAAYLPESAVLFMLNAHRFVEDVQPMQAFWNLRDAFKQNGRMLVLLGVYFKTPLEIQGDVIRLIENLPTRAELRKVIRDQYLNTDLGEPSETVLKAGTDALIGLAMFTAEQVTAMSLGNEGLNIDQVWEHKIQRIETIPGLSVLRPDKNVYGLDKLKGVDNVRDYMQKLIDIDDFGAVALLDEFEKQVKGGMSEWSGDNGVSHDQVGAILQFNIEKKVHGVMVAGVSGCGKTATAYAVAASSGKPLVKIDLGAMKGGSSGEAEGRIRVALATLDAIAEGRILMIATANKTAEFSPEMNRRFPDQFFYDFPDEAGREALWPVYVKLNDLTPEQATFVKGWDRGWTGDEIARACERAKKFKETVVETSRYILLSAESGKAKHDALRQQAHGKFLSASKPGWYEAPSAAPELSDAVAAQAFNLTDGARKIRMDKNKMN